MKSWIQVQFCNIPLEKQERLLASLIVQGYEAFEEKEQELIACIRIQDFDEKVLDSIGKEFEVDFVRTEIEETNWNQVWESNFQPVILGDFAGIRADFHPAIPGIKYEIIITPKMSFGTGHHATTVLMMEGMRDIDFYGKKVLDFGTGTGILAILAEKMGALAIDAVDYDEWSISNASENLELNRCKKTVLIRSETASTGSQYDILLANINRNVILDNIRVLKEQMLPGGRLLLSGLLEADEPRISDACCGLGLKPILTSRKNGWIAILLSGT